MLSLEQLKDHSNKALEKEQVESNPTPILRFYANDMKYQAKAPKILKSLHSGILCTSTTSLWKEFMHLNLGFSEINEISEDTRTFCHWNYGFASVMSGSAKRLMSNSFPARSLSFQVLAWGLIPDVHWQIHFRTGCLQIPSALQQQCQTLSGRIWQRLVHCLVMIN